MFASLPVRKSQNLMGREQPNITLLLAQFQLRKTKEFIKFHAKTLNIVLDDWSSLLNLMPPILKPYDFISYNLATLLPLGFQFANTSWDYTSHPIKTQFDCFTLYDLIKDERNY